MTARRPIARLTSTHLLGWSCGVLVVVVLMLMSTGGAGAASAGVVVAADVSSSTNLAVDPVGAPPNGCQSNTANVTSFGAITVNSSAITSADCNIVWGSSNDSAMLRIYQADGFGNALQRTVGGTWATQNSPTTTAFRDIDVVDDQLAWAVGDNGLIAKTTDGGATWVQQTSGVTVRLGGVVAVNASTAYAVGDFSGVSGVFIRTTDGGATWSAPIDVGATGNLYEITRTDATHMWVVGINGMIFFSADGGTTWTPQTSNTTELLLQVRAVDSKVLWAVGYNGTVLRTIDGGATWTVYPNIGGLVTQLRDVRAFDANNAWVVGQFGHIARTTDGGATWTAMTSGATHYYGIAGTSMNSMTIVGAGGVVKSTVEGGSTWTSQTSATTDDLRTMRMTNAGSFWAAGLNGTIAQSPGVTVPNYDDDNIGSDYNWSEGANMFGACLETATGGAAGGAGVGGWSVAGNNNCTTASAAWNPIAATSASSGAKVAAVTPGPSATAAVTLRFGFKTSSNQGPGTYEAPLVVEVVAPNV